MEKKEYPKDVGCIWIIQGAKGDYLSLSLEIDGVKHNFAAFKNNNKKQPNHPDYRIPAPRIQSNEPSNYSKHEAQINLVNSQKAPQSKVDNPEFDQMKFSTDSNMVESDVPF